MLSQKTSPPTRALGPALLVAGVLLFLVALGADSFGIGTSPGLGRLQIIAAVVGVAIAALGMLKLRR